MFNFKDWYLDEKTKNPSVNPQIGQWEISVEKLKSTLERLKKVLKDKKIDIVIDDKKGKPEVKVKPKEEPKKTEPKKDEKDKDKEADKKEEPKENPYLPKKPIDKENKKEEPKSTDKTL